ncbi:metallophosphoesterase family protein [Pontiellaceae bacterium B12227]|nr:metallophosphoesterase family protein [Pontiellaceae bacterium B12227]
MREDWLITRCTFLKASGAIAGGIALGPAQAAGNTASLRFGIVTDAHYADTDPKGRRFYQDSTGKMAECVALMNDQKVDFLIELGDFKDQNQPATEESTLKNLAAIESVYGQFKGPRYHVLGNHDVDSISKEQFLAHVENTGIKPGSKYYSFDSKGLHFIVLDPNFKADGSDYDHGNFDWKDANIPSKELVWLKNDLAKHSAPTIVFIHQPLDPRNDKVFIRNAEAVRQVLQENKKVLAVFQGHLHGGNHARIDGVHYYTLKAMVEGPGTENNSYAIVEVDHDLNITVNGYSRAVSKKLAHQKETAPIHS